MNLLGEASLSNLRNFSSRFTDEQLGITEEISDRWKILPWLDARAGFAFRQDHPKKEVKFALLARSIRNAGDNWRENQEIVTQVQLLVDEKLNPLIEQKEVENDERAKAYHQRRKEILLKDLNVENI